MILMIIIIKRYIIVFSQFNFNENIYSPLKFLFSKKKLKKLNYNFMKPVHFKPFLDIAYKVKDL